jgi:hypothetical protein
MIESKAEHIDMQPKQRRAKVGGLGNEYLRATGIEAENA